MNLIYIKDKTYEILKVLSNEFWQEYKITKNDVLNRYINRAYVDEVLFNNNKFYLVSEVREATLLNSKNKLKNNEYINARRDKRQLRKYKRRN
jgi:hypothetical protein